jgi:ferredoxin
MREQSLIPSPPSHPFSCPTPFQAEENPISNIAKKLNVSLGPIGLTLGGDIGESADGRTNIAERLWDEEMGDEPRPADGVWGESISRMSTAEWREKYEKDGRVDLWVEEEFNAASRMIGGRETYLGEAVPGTYTGEGPGKTDGTVATHTVTIKNNFDGQTVVAEIPEDRYILHTAEEQGLNLPYACRQGCCTACAVKVQSGDVYQYQALGVSKQLREDGYALMCVAFPLSDVQLETIPEDEIYELQFGKYFTEMALDPNGANVVRDDFALELTEAE